MRCRRTTFGLATRCVEGGRTGRRARPCRGADAIVCDAWQPLPIADGVVGVALDVFAPRPGAEFARVLRPDGVLLVVTPTAEHLTELDRAARPASVDPDKADRVAAQLGAAFDAGRPGNRSAA